MGVDSSTQQTDSLTDQVGWLGVRVGGRLTLTVHLSHEPGELSQWLQS